MSLSSASSLLMTLHHLKIGIALEGDQIRVQAREGLLTPKLRAAIAEDKPFLLEILRVPAEVERIQFVAEGLATFPCAELQDEETWEKFRDLAQRHFGHLDVWDRIAASFRGLAEIISIMGTRQPADIVKIAHLRGCATRLENLCEALRARELAPAETDPATGGPA